MALATWALLLVDAILVVDLDLQTTEAILGWTLRLWLLNMMSRKKKTTPQRCVVEPLFPNPENPPFLILFTKFPTRPYQGLFHVECHLLMSPRMHIFVPGSSAHFGGRGVTGGWGAFRVATP